METKFDRAKRLRNIILDMLDWRPNVLSGILIELSEDTTIEGVELFNYIKGLVL